MKSLSPSQSLGLEHSVLHRIYRSLIVLSFQLDIVAVTKNNSCSYGSFHSAIKSRSSLNERPLFLSGAGLSKPTHSPFYICTGGMTTTSDTPPPASTNPPRCLLEDRKRHILPWNVHRTFLDIFPTPPRRREDTEHPAGVIESSMGLQVISLVAIPLLRWNLCDRRLSRTRALPT